jgi:hypothetical protein
MDSFSFVFSLFGLLMGLALAEVISGLGTAIELRHKIRIGWLTPLLGLLIAFDLTSFWMFAWQLRESIPVNFISLAGGLLIFGIYYLIAQMVFPDDLELWPDLDAYYFAHKKWLLGGVYACNVLALAGQQAIGVEPFADPNIVLAVAAFTVGMAGAIFLPGKRTNIAFLLYQIMLYPLFDILGIMGSGRG